MYKTRTFPVLKRLIPSLHKRAMRLVWPDGQGVVRREGALFLLDLKYICDRSILLRGVSEPEERAYLFGHLQNCDCDIFVDVGANIGIYTIFAALKISCASIIAFEPNPKCHDRLRANLLLNRVTDKVETYQAAVSDHNGTVPFEIDPRGDHLLSKVGQEGNSASVPCVRLDDKVTVTGQRIALKIDVEGHEMSVLKGMKALLQNNNCFLQIECWPENAARFTAAMQTEGYTCLHRIGGDYYFAKA